MWIAISDTQQQTWLARRWGCPVVRVPIHSILLYRRWGDATHWPRHCRTEVLAGISCWEIKFLNTKPSFFCFCLFVFHSAILCKFSFILMDRVDKALGKSQAKFIVPLLSWLQGGYQYCAQHCFPYVSMCRCPLGSQENIFNSSYREISWFLPSIFKLCSKEKGRIRERGNRETMEREKFTKPNCVFVHTYI